MAVICTALLLQGCSSNSENEQGMRGLNSPPPAVEAVQAQFGALPLEERLSGTVRSDNQVAIYPRISAPVEQVFVENGESVQAGDPLVRLDDRDYRERLNQAEANLRIAQAQAKQAEVRLVEVQNQLRRQRALAERDLISSAELQAIEAQAASSEADYDLAQARVDQARSTMNERETELSRTIIRSPVNGVVGGRNVEVGMQVDTGARLFTVGDVTQSKVLVSLTESMLRYITTGQTAKVFSESLEDSVIYGEVSRISPFLQEGSFSTQAEIDVPNPDGALLPGMFVTVDIMYGESEQATLVPISAIYRHPRTGVEGIYVAPGFGSEVAPITEVDSGDPPPLSEPTELEFKPIRVVAKGRESAGVVGVNSGDWILTVGQSLMVGRQDNIARIRAVTWDRILSMQRSRPQDLLRQVLEEQEMARAQN